MPSQAAQGATALKAGQRTPSALQSPHGPHRASNRLPVGA